MVAHSGGSHGNETASRMPNGSSASSSASGGGVAKQALKKGPWTAAEDAILIDYVKKNGEGNWNAVQKNTSLCRCGKSCRLRWTNHLRPNLKKGSFTPEEERLILQLHAQLGNKWATMATQLPGRTDNEIKNYWNTRIKRQICQGLPLYLNDITPQKQPTSTPALQLEPRSVPAIRGWPPLKIPARTIPQALALAHTHHPSPTSSPVPPSSKSYNHLKTTFTHSLSLFNPATAAVPLSPSTNGLPSPHSPATLSPSLVLNNYDNPNASFPGFSPLTLPVTSSFHFGPLNFNLNSPEDLQTIQLPCYNPLKPVELPSNQLFLSQEERTAAEPEHETKSKLGMPQSSSTELLQNLLEQATAPTLDENLQRQGDLFNLQDEFSLKSGYAWDVAIGSDNSSAETGLGIKDEVKENGSVPNELSKLLLSIPSPAGIPEEFLDNLSMPRLEFGSSLMVNEDGLRLDMQQIASLFQVDTASSDISRQAASFPWDNLPRIC